MDGTLLDLHFDTYFWLTLLPQKVAQHKALSIEQAQAFMATEFARVHGRIEWYCLDYWSELLDLDIATMKLEVAHLIQMRPDTLPFLDALKASGRRVILLTNAHPGSLSLKIERTQLDAHIDEIVSTHTYGVSKEFQSLWQQVHADYAFAPAQTLFVDDNVPILHASKEYGIGYQLAVANPDSKLAPTPTDDFPCIEDFRELLSAIER
jgi:putative hydrolase of the HAD superfamily